MGITLVSLQKRMKGMVMYHKQHTNQYCHAAWKRGKYVTRVYSKRITVHQPCEAVCLLSIALSWHCWSAVSCSAWAFQERCDLSTGEHQERLRHPEITACDRTERTDDVYLRKCHSSVELGYVFKFRQRAFVEEGNDLFSVSVVGKMRPDGPEVLLRRFR